MPVYNEFPRCISRRPHSITSFVARSISWKTLSSENTLLLQKEEQGQPLTPRMAVEAFREGSRIVQASFASNYWSREWFFCGYECVTLGGAAVKSSFRSRQPLGAHCTPCYISAHKRRVGSLWLSPVLVCCLRCVWKVCSFAYSMKSKLSSSESPKLLGFKWEKYVRSINALLAASSLPTRTLDGASCIYVILHRYLLALENV